MEKINSFKVLEIEGEFKSMKENFLAVLRENEEMSLKIQNLNLESEKLSLRIDEEKEKAKGKLSQSIIGPNTRS